MTVDPLVLKVHRTELETESGVKTLSHLALIHLPWSPCVVKQWEGCQLCYLDREGWCVTFCVCFSSTCVDRERRIALCYVMMKYWVYDLVKFLSYPAQIAFHNLMRQIFFNGNPGQGHDCHDKLSLKLLKAGMHALLNALCNMIGLKSDL